MWIFRYKKIPAWISAKLRKEDTQEYAFYLAPYVELFSVEDVELRDIAFGWSEKSVKESWDYCEKLANDR